MSQFTIGICKGRTSHVAQELLSSLGYTIQVHPYSEQRCYKIDVKRVEWLDRYGEPVDVRCVFVSPRDVPQYLLKRVVDVAICYDDVLHHLGDKNYHLKPVLPTPSEPSAASSGSLRVGSMEMDAVIPLGAERALQQRQRELMGGARLCLVGKAGVDLKSPHNRIVSEYVDASARLSNFRVLTDLGLQGTFIESHGAAEALIVGGAAELAIVVVETGETLAANELQIYAEVAPLTLNAWVNCDNPRGWEFMLAHGTKKTIPTRVVVDGIDGAGKSTIVEMLRADRELKQYFFLDRGFPSAFTLLPDEKLPAETPPERVILLECDPDAAKHRLAGRVRIDKFETRAGLWYFRQKFRELSGRYGWPVIDTTATSPKDIVDHIKRVKLLLPESPWPTIENLTQGEFDALPLVAQGESKVIRRLGVDFDVIQYIPSIYSHKKRRADFIPGSEVQRMESTRHALRLLAWEQVPHTYWYVGSKFIMAQRLEQPPPPVEVVVKSRYTGTDKYRYVGLDKMPTRTGAPVVDAQDLYPAPYVRFDWRNANTHAEGDVAMSESVADWFIKVDDARDLALTAYKGLNRHFHRFGVDIWDLCFFVTADGKAIFGEVSPDNGRYKRMDDSKDTDLDKDIWRAGGSSELVLQKWTLLARMMKDYTDRFFRDLYAVKLTDHIADWPLTHDLLPWSHHIEFNAVLESLKEANWEWVTDEPTMKTLAYRVWSLTPGARMLLVKGPEKLNVHLVDFEERYQDIVKALWYHL